MASLLEGKPSYYGLIIGLLLAGGLIFAANYFYISKVDDDIRALIELRQRHFGFVTHSILVILSATRRSRREAPATF